MREWNAGRVRVAASNVDIQSRRSIESLVYSYDYTIDRILAGLPILPSLGLELEW